MTPRWCPAACVALALVLCASVRAAPQMHTFSASVDQQAADEQAQIAACRRQGNLFAYYPPMGRCMALLDEEASPCSEMGAVLVLNATTRAASCFRLPCGETQVLLNDGRCHDKWTVCAGRENRELVLLETGLGACDCQDGHVFWSADGRCHAVYTRGPCGEGEHLVWIDGAARCEATPCADGQVPWRGQCVPADGHGCLDSKHGHLRLNAATLTYQCTLRCPDAMVEVALDCHKLYTRGPCAVGEYIEPVSGTRYGRCAPNPCGPDDMLPWAGKCWQPGQLCGADADDDDWEEAPTVRTTRAPPPMLMMTYSDILRGAASSSSDDTSANDVMSTPASQVVKQSVERVSLQSATVTVSGSTTSSAPTASSTMPSLTTTTTAVPTPASTTRSSLPLHLQYLLGNAPDLDQLPFMRHSQHRRGPPGLLHVPPPPSGRPRAPSASVSEALLARRSLIPPPPPASASGLLELLGLPAFHGQASETSFSASLPAPMLPEVQYTYDGKMIRNPLYRDRRRRRAVSGAAPSPSPSPSPPAGARIAVHPDTRQVTCTTDLLLSAPECYAHFKCRPGSRRDALDECVHSGSTFGELHPRRCPHGMRHNRLTGQCRPAA